MRLAFSVSPFFFHLTTRISFLGIMALAFRFWCDKRSRPLAFILCLGRVSKRAGGLVTSIFRMRYLCAYRVFHCLMYQGSRAIHSLFLTAGLSDVLRKRLAQTFDVGRPALEITAVIPTAVLPTTTTFDVSY